MGRRPSAAAGLPPVDLVLHAAAWTDVDGAEDEPQEAAAVNVGGTANAASLGAPLVAFSSDYVFDGSKREPYVESDGPNPLSAYGRSKLHGEGAAGERAWVVRSSWLFGPTAGNFLLTMLRLGAERDEVAVVDDQRGSPDLCRASRRGDARVGGERCSVRALPRRRGRRMHVGRVRGGDLRRGGARLPGAGITTAEFGAKAPRPAYSVLRSEQPVTPLAAALARGPARLSRALAG